MKKVLIILAASGFVVAIGEPLFAAEVTLGGEVRVRGRYHQARDFNKSNPPNFLDRARLDMRTRVSVSANITEGLAAFMDLETYGRFAMGTASPQATTNFGTGADNAGGAGVPGFRFAWMDARLPGTPVTFRLGRQAQSFGHGYVFDTSVYGGDAITVRGPLGGWSWEIGWVKTRETDVVAAASTYPTGYFQPAAAGPAGTDNDEEYYTFKLSGSPAGNHSLEAYVVWHRDNGCIVGSLACATGPAISVAPTAGAPFGSQSGGGANEATVALAWDGRFGPFVPRAEVAYQGGTAYTSTNPANQTVKRSAWMANAGFDYDLTPQWRILVDGGWGSGNGKNPTDPDFKTNHQWFQANALESGPWSFSYDLGSPGPFLMGDGVTSRRFQVASVDNLAFVSLRVRWTPVLPWTLQVEATKLGASRTFDGMGGPVTGANPSKDLGWNVGVRVWYRPYRNLTIPLRAGAWIPGKYFDGGLPTAIRKADTAYILRFDVVVTF